MTVSSGIVIVYRIKCMIHWCFSVFCIVFCSCCVCFACVMHMIGVTRVAMLFVHVALGVAGQVCSNVFVI